MAWPTFMSAGIYFAEHSSKSNQYVYGIGGGSGCPEHKDRSCYTCDRCVCVCMGWVGVWVWSGWVGVSDSLPPLQTVAVVSGDTRKANGAAVSSEDCPCPSRPSLSDWSTKCWGSQLSRVCHLPWRTGVCVCVCMHIILSPGVLTEHGCGLVAGIP